MQAKDLFFVIPTYRFRDVGELLVRHEQDVAVRVLRREGRVQVITVN
jgi:hypothetical protein